MSSANFAFDDFVDDCFIEEDPICARRGETSLELVSSQLISELVSENQESKAA